MIIGAIFLGFVAACALVLFVAIIKGALDESQTAEAAEPRPSAIVILPGDREARFTREPARDRQVEPVH